MAVTPVDSSASPIPLISRNTNISFEAKRRLAAHRDFLALSRRSASFQTALYDVIESFAMYGERLTHLYGEQGNGKPASFTAEFIPAHWDWVEEQQNRFWGMEGKKPSVGEVLSAAIMLRLPSDAPLALKYRRDRRTREGSSQGESEGP